MDKLLFLILLSYFGLKPISSIELIDIEKPEDITNDVTNWDYKNSYVRVTFNEEINYLLKIAKIICKDCEDKDKPNIVPKPENNVLKLTLADYKTNPKGYEWTLYVNGKIDYETMKTDYEFDMEIGTRITFFISINNIDDNPPLITSNNKDCTVKETPMGVGETKCKYKVTDMDGNDFIQTINFDFTKLSSEDIKTKFDKKKEIKEDPNEQNVKLNKYIEVTLTVKEALDFETVPLYFFNLKATDSGNNQNEFPVIVNVEDLPDTPPKWTKVFSSQKFYEEGVETFEVKAIDGDTQINPTSPIKYKIDFTATDQQLKEKIKIDKQGKIKVDKIDRDTLDKKLSDTIEFKLTATEVMPSCDFPSEVKSCPDHSNEDLTEEVCKICKGNWINMYTEATATFLILDINDNKAQVHKLNNIVIPENRTLVYNEQKLTINDIDLGINAKCDIKLIEKCDLFIQSKDNEKVEDAFQLIPSSGFEEWESQISVIKTILDYEKPEMRNIKLFVHTEDFQNNQTCDTQINIIVENRNDEIPVFYDCDTDEQKTDFVFKHEELVGKDTEIGKICANDKDVDDFLTFDFVATSTKDSFKIEKYENKGMIIKTIKDKTFDFETMPQVVINVKATDNLNTKYNDLLHTEFATVNIDVIEVNYKPPRIQLNGEIKNVTENVPPGTIVVGEQEEKPHIITATDPNTSADLKFSIIWNESWATKQGRRAKSTDFEGCLDIETYPNDEEPNDKRNVYGRLVVKQIKDENGNDMTIDYEKFEFLYLKIKVNDNDQQIGKTFDTVTISIPIEDVNDNPPVFDMNSVNAKRSVTETDKTTKTTIGTIIATDADGPNFNKIYYYVKPMNINSQTQDVIQIDENTGELYTKENVKIDADIYCNMGLLYEVRATDKTDYNTTANFKINIIDTNNKYPSWVNEITNLDHSIYENVTQETLITLKAHDEDCSELFHTVVFVLNDPSLAKIFKVDKTSGVVSVSCEDSSKKCLDRDGTDGTNGHDTYKVAVQLQDMNGTGDFKKTDISFVVPIEDVNDNAPILQDVLLVNIKENADINSYIGQIIAIDIDKPNTPNSEIEYSIKTIFHKDDENGQEVEVDKKLLQINSTNGFLNTHSSFRDYFGTIIVEIFSKDHGEPSLNDTKKYSFEVAKYNFEKPTFLFPLDDDITLSTNQAPYSRLITGKETELPHINATDNQNEKYNIQFKIISENNKKANLFEIHPIQISHSNVADLWMTKTLAEDDPTEYDLVLEASHDGVGEENKVEIKTHIKFVDPDAEPYFNEEQNECKFHETYTNETCNIVPAFDPTAKPIIYYHLYNSDNKIFNVIKAPEHGEGTKLSLLVGLDIEETGLNYTVYIRAANTITNPPLKPKNPKSILTVPIILIDINNHPPVFERDLWVVGLSEQDEPNNKTAIIQLKATDVDEVDDGKLEFDMIPDTLKASNDDLLKIQNPFTVYKNGDIKNNFKPTDGMKGYFTFQVKVTDTPPQSHTDTSSVKISIISEAVRVSFIFNNTEDDIRNKQIEIEGIFQKTFGYKCNLDSTGQATDDSGNIIPGQVRAKFHFMNEKDETIDKDEIIRKSNDLNNMAELKIQFERIGLKYMSKNTNSDNESDNKEEDLQKLKIIFIVVTIILALTVVILLIAFVLKTKSLSRRLEAMNVPIFGSNNSGLNKIGVNAPGTNRHAVEANPVYHTDIKQNFDTISQGSGDSDLIGIENSEDFHDYSNKKKFTDGDKNYKPTLNPLASAPNTDELDNIQL